MNLSMKQKQTHRHRELTCGCQKGEQEREAGVSKCKLLHLGQKATLPAVYSTGNYIQDPEIDHNGKEYFLKECIYRIESLCRTAEINTTL